MYYLPPYLCVDSSAVTNLNSILGILHCYRLLFVLVVFYNLGNSFSVFCL